MADYNPRYNRGGYGRYKREKNFVAMEAGTDAFYLEDEANESQWIQNELRADLVRRKYYSGIYSQPEDDIILASDVFNSNEQIFNSFLVKPMVANINGYFIDVFGNNGYQQNGNINEYKDLNYIVLPDAPEEGEYYDFVYLEMAFVEIRYTAKLWQYGNRNHSYGPMLNDLFDKRINGETNRRIQLQWSIYSARVPMNSENAQMRSGGMFDEQTFAMLVPAHGGYFGNSTAGFIHAPNHPYYKSTDKGLWIAGSGLTTIEHQLYSTDGYSYAIPLFKVIRRNSNGYSSGNLYGSEKIDSTKDCSSTRPDGKFSNIIYKDDIIDLRNFINPKSLQSILQTNFEKLMLNELNDETKLYSTSFGLDEIVPDNDTIFYESCNRDTIDVNLIKGGQTYSFAPGLEREGIIFENNSLFEFKRYVKNLSLSGTTLQLIVKIPEGINTAGLFTIREQYNDKIWAWGFIRNGQLYVQTDERSIIYDFNKHFNKYTHLAFAFRDHRMQLIVNNRIIESVETESELHFDDYITLYVGFDEHNNYYANNVLFDEIELSKVFENQFSRIPKNITSNDAEFSVDTQFGRANYSKTGSKDTYTFHVTQSTDFNGNLNMSFTLPFTIQFTNEYPTIYFDNESVPVANEVLVSWEYINSSQWNVHVHGLGANVTYNLVVIAPVVYPGKSGIDPFIKKAHLLRAEKCAIDFMAVQDLTEWEEHTIAKLPKATTFTTHASLITYNPYLNTNGFLNALKLKYTIYNQNQIILSKSTYTDLVAIYAVILNDKNILNDFYEDENNFIINLTGYYNEIVDIYAVTKYNAVVYSPTKGGIDNLFKLEEINDYGNGQKSTFVYRSESKIMSMLSAKLAHKQYHVVYVNGVPKRVSITIDGTFIHYTFDYPPENKANIKTYIVTEYDPLRSERLEFFCEVAKRTSNLDDISTLNGTNIIYHDNEIFVTTDGYGLYPQRDNSINIQGQEVSFAERAMYHESLVPVKPDEDLHTLAGDTVVTPSEEFIDVEGKTVYTENRASAATAEIDHADIAATDDANNLYKYIRFVTEQNIVSPSSYDDEVTVHSSNFKYSYGLNGEETEIPLFRFAVVDDNKPVHPSAEDNFDAYKTYMLNKKMLNIDVLPAVSRLEFSLSPTDLLKSSKCDIIFGSDQLAHVVTKDRLPISTNLSAAINYVVPLNGYSLLKTFNKLIIANTYTKVFNGITQTSIDGKSFYSLTKLENPCKHVNVFPFLIKDEILKLGILTTYCENSNIYIDAMMSAFNTFKLNNRYLLKD